MLTIVINGVSVRADCTSMSTPKFTNCTGCSRLPPYPVYDLDDLAEKFALSIPLLIPDPTPAEYIVQCYCKTTYGTIN